MGSILAFAVLTLMITAVGGGWWALGRVDPLLAIPGLGWASVAIAWASGAASAGRQAAIAAIVLTLSLMAVTVVLAGQIPWLQLAIVLVVVCGVAWLMIHFWHGLDMRAGQPWRRRLGRLALCVTMGMFVQSLGWPLLAMLYQSPSRAPNPPHIALLTSLPLTPATSIGAAMRDAATRAPILDALDRMAVVTPVDRADAATLAANPLLMLAHPRAMPPEDLVAVDAFIRRGGRAVILADGLLSWPPPHPLGDPRNPPVTSLLTPLLSHWGLTLDAPEGLRQAVVERHYSGMRVTLFSPGRLQAVPDAPCTVTLYGLMAQCRIGQGRVTVLADADMLNGSLWLAPGGAHPSPANWRADNAHWLITRMAETGGWRLPPRWIAPVWTH